LICIIVLGLHLGTPVAYPPIVEHSITVKTRFLK